MGATNRHSAEAWRLAERQHGVVARRQLLALGLSPGAIQHRLDRGRLHRVGRGVYAVGRQSLTQRGWWMAAVLGSGPRAALSHSSAAALWGFGRQSGATEVSVPVTSGRSRMRLRIHRRPQLGARDTTVEDEIPVTTPVRTAIDLAARSDRAHVERMIDELDRLELIDPETLFDAVSEHPGQRGVGVLSEILGERTFRLTDSELERRFLRLVDGIKMKQPLTQQWVGGFRVDFFWPDLGLVVETDGLRYHRTPAQQARDRVRDQAHTAAGLTPLRFSHAQVRYEPRRVGEILHLTSERLRVDAALAARRRSGSAR